MAKYKTKQRECLLEFLKNNPDAMYSAAQIKEALAEEDISISAVYRNLAQLEEEGLLQKSTREGTREACYRYVDIDECRMVLHLSCRKCGKLIHMDPEETARILRSINMHDRFAVDMTDTVLYGTCDTCLRARRNDRGEKTRAFGGSWL